MTTDALTAEDWVERPVSALPLFPVLYPGSDGGTSEDAVRM